MKMVEPATAARLALAVIPLLIPIGLYADAVTICLYSGINASRDFEDPKVQESFYPGIVQRSKILLQCEI